MPKRNLAWLAIILLAVAALWVATRWDELLPRSQTGPNPASRDPVAGLFAYLDDNYVMTLGDRQRYREIQALNPAVQPERLQIGQAIRLPDK